MFLQSDLINSHVHFTKHCLYDAEHNVHTDFLIYSPKRNENQNIKLTEAQHHQISFRTAMINFNISSIFFLVLFFVFRFSHGSLLFAC